jgi:hypothetical protein
MIDFDLDIPLELNHLIYIFVISLTWLGLSFWGDHQLHSYYEVLPQYAGLFITLSYWIGFVGIGIGVLLIIWVLVE